MKSRIKKQALKIGIALLVLAALVVGIAVPAFADTGKPKDTPTKVTPPPPAFRIVEGQVTSVTANTTVSGNATLAVLTAGKQTITITVDKNTQYFLVPMGAAQSTLNSRITSEEKQDKQSAGTGNRAAPKLKEIRIPSNWRTDLGWLGYFLDHQGALSDIAAGDRVIVRANNSNVAAQVLIIRAPVNKTIKGTITTDTAGHLIITPTTGSAVTLNVVASTRITLKGQTSITGYAVAVYNSTNNNALVVNIQANPPPATSSSSSDK